MPTWVKYEGVAFNKEWVASKTFKQFCDHEKHHGLSEDQMREVYNICKAKPVKKEEEKADEQPSE